MRLRNFVGKSEEPTTTTLRRSPRFLQKDKTSTDDDPKTPNPQPRRMRVSCSDLTPVSSIRKGSLKKSQNQRSGKVSEKVNETHLRPNLRAEQLKSTRLDSPSKVSHCLRRSPRFSGDYNIRVSYSDVTPIRSKGKGTLNKSQKERSSKVTEKSKEAQLGSKRSKKLRAEQRRSQKLDGLSKDSHCLRRSSRVSGDSKYEDLRKIDRFSDSCRKSDGGISRRVTRSFSRANDKESASGCGNGVIGSIPGQAVSVQSRSKSGVHSSQQCLYKVEKRVTRSSSRGTETEDSEKAVHHDSFECLDKEVISHKGNGKVDKKVSEQCAKEPVNKRRCKASVSEDSLGGGDKKGFANDVDKGLVGKKRKRAEAEEGHRVLHGWTREQEVALQRAYFATKPTPHFWKKVSKMIPGKSAQDCFDKIHSDHMTPPQHQPRSRAKGINSSSLSFSTSKLLNSSESKGKKLRKSKRKNFLSHKAVRELLQKQCKIDQDNEADLFTVLEPTLDPSIRIIPEGSLLSTPECNKGLGFLKRCKEKSSSAQRKHLSRFSPSFGATLTSPPVLKQIKNKALHNKYIDQLHTREAKRKAASQRATKGIQRKNDAKPNDAQRTEVIKAAKDALIFDAREAIDQLRHLQNCTTSNDDDSVDFADITEDDVEDES